MTEDTHRDGQCQGGDHLQQHKPAMTACKSTAELQQPGAWVTQTPSDGRIAVALHQLVTGGHEDAPTAMAAVGVQVDSSTGDPATKQIHMVEFCPDSYAPAQVEVVDVQLLVEGVGATLDHPVAQEVEPACAQRSEVRAERCEEVHAWA